MMQLFDTSLKNDWQIVGYQEKVLLHQQLFYWYLNSSHSKIKIDN